MAQIYCFVGTGQIEVYWTLNHWRSELVESISIGCYTLRLKTTKPTKIIIGTVFEWKKHKCSKDHIRLHTYYDWCVHLDSSKDVSHSYSAPLKFIRSLGHFMRFINARSALCSVGIFISWSAVPKMCVCMWAYTILNVYYSLVLSYYCVWVSYHWASIYSDRRAEKKKKEKTTSNKRLVGGSEREKSCNWRCTHIIHTYMSIKSIAMLFEILTFLFQCALHAMECENDGKWQRNWNKFIFLVGTILIFAVFNGKLKNRSHFLHTTKRETVLKV